jgi:biotin carboxylase
VDRPDVLERIRDACDAETYMLTFNVTPLEQRCAEALGVLLYGPHPDIVSLGSKSGARTVATDAGVPVLPGAEDVFTRAALFEALDRLRPGAAAVIKLNNGFSGQGNAIVDLGVLTEPLEDTPTVFCAGEESWPSFLSKIEAEGAVVEQLARAPGMVSPSVQMRALPDGSVEVVSTHDQILGGPDEQVYLGCRFPASPLYRMQIADQAQRVGKALADRGVVGPFGMDFLVLPAADGFDVYLSEINLRMGGTTHPFLMAHMVTGGEYDQGSGELLVGGAPRAYVATDNLKSPAYAGLTPVSVIEAVTAAGIAYEPATHTGVLLHLLGALPVYGKLGATCIARGPEGAEELYLRLIEVLDTVSL